MKKHPEIEQALIYKTGMINKTSSKIIEPKTWKTEYDLLKKKYVVAKNTYMNASEEIEIFSNILKKITQVNKTKVAEKELILSAVDFPSSPCKDGYYRLNVKDPSRKSSRYQISAKTIDELKEKYYLFEKKGKNGRCRTTIHDVYELTQSEKLKYIKSKEKRVLES